MANVDPNLLRELIWAVKNLFGEVRSMNEAYRKVNDLPPPEPLPTTWDELLQEDPDPLGDGTVGDE